MPDVNALTDEKPLPATYRRWHLYGSGLENVGKNGEPETVPMPMPGPNEILVRHDACGICYSDIKIINLGGEHPRLVGRDLAENPVVMGHEVSLTVVQVGENLTEQFAPGQRFIVQADVYYQGRNLAYGYAIMGGMSEYGIIGPEVLMGDEGCYLLPLQESTGNAEAALVEPWACVEASYHWKIRSAPHHKPRWRGLFVHEGESDGVTPDVLPSIHIWGNDLAALQRVEGLFDEIIFIGTPTPELVEAAAPLLDKNGVLRFLFPDSLSRPVAVDVGRIHYDGHGYVGGATNDRAELKAGGTCWMVGAAGPMGQMHVQRALSLPNPPARLVCTDRQPVRLAALRERFEPMARERGVELVTFNIRETTPDFDALAPNGFDDIVIMVPSIEAIEEAFPRLAVNGVLNIFAGVARGVTANLLISDVATKNVRIVGTSGSSIADMRRVRDVMESGQLDTGASLAAIGGLEAFRDGLDAVKSSRFPGKTVIFPHIHDLPLTSLPDLATVRPNVFAKLRDGRYWTDEAEAELMKEAV